MLPRNFGQFLIGAATLPVLFLCWETAVSASGAPQARIGVLANWGVEKCAEDWNPMILALRQALPGVDFTLVPLPFEAVEEAVAGARIDFAVVNPAIYVNLEVTHDVIRIATFINQAVGRTASRFGGVFFTRADRQDIRSFDQIRGKRLAATAPSSLGGWLMGSYTLQQNGLDPGKDLAELQFHDAHDQVIRSVLDGSADVGTARTDTLERMEASGKLNLSDLRILTPAGFRPDPTFPFLHSTRLVPEWPFAKLSHTSESLAKSVAAALLLMETQGSQWTVPLPYESIHEIMRSLKVAPYEQFGQVSVGDFILQHSRLVMAMAGMLLALLVLVAYFRSLNRRLQAALHKVREAEIELTRQANTDGLTGLCNRKWFNEVIETEICRALRYERPLAMILMDLDHFKAINDKYGHPVGDDVLIAVADRIRTSVRRGDVAARVGGEEFAVLLPETGILAAALMAERIRAEIAASVLARSGNNPVGCTVSIGVADVCPSIQNHSALYTAVDEALYQAKRLGRNRVEKSHACAWSAGAGTGGAG
ncbi:MAG: diguanylate cyclase [Acidobacteriota bacterium]